MGTAAPPGDDVVRLVPRSTARWLAGAFAAFLAAGFLSTAYFLSRFDGLVIVLAAWMLSFTLSRNRTTLVEVSSAGLRFHGPFGVSDEVVAADIAAIGVAGPVLGGLLLPRRSGWWKGGQLVVIAPSGHLVFSRNLGWFRLADIEAATARFGIVTQKWRPTVAQPWNLLPARWPEGVGAPPEVAALEDPVTSATIRRARAHARRLFWGTLAAALVAIVLLVALEQPDIEWLNLTAGWTLGTALFAMFLILVATPLRNRPLRLAKRFLGRQSWYACEAVVLDGAAMRSQATVTFLHPATGVPMGTREIETGSYGRWLQPMQRCWLLCANGADGMPVIVAPPARDAFAHLRKVR